MENSFASMNPEVKSLWLDALRSGEYRQGYTRLKTEDGNFCCLGVLCELAVKAGVISPAGRDNPYGGPTEWGYHSSEGFNETGLPPEVQKWAKVGQSGEMIDTDEDGFNTYDYLSDLNDSGDYTFEDIANVIEERL